MYLNNWFFLHALLCLHLNFSPSLLPLSKILVAAWLHQMQWTEQRWRKLFSGALYSNKSNKPALKSWRCSEFRSIFILFLDKIRCLLEAPSRDRCSRFKRRNRRRNSEAKMPIELRSCGQSHSRIGEPLRTSYAAGRGIYWKGNCTLIFLILTLKI